MDTFFLGTHEEGWLSRAEFPLFVSGARTTDRLRGETLTARLEGVDGGQPLPLWIEESCNRRIRIGAAYELDFHDVMCGHHPRI